MRIRNRNPGVPLPGLEPLSSRTKLVVTAHLPFPTPFPTVGIPPRLRIACNRNGFLAIGSLRFTPDFGRLYGSRGGCQFEWMPRSPTTSLVAHATNEFPPRTGKGHMSLNEFTTSLGTSLDG